MVNEVAKLITENSKRVFFRDDYLMEPIYEPICNNLFIARVMKDLSELIEFEALSKLKQRRGIKSVEYDDDGTVVSYELKN